MWPYFLNFVAVAVFPLALAGYGGHLATLALPAGSREKKEALAIVWTLAIVGVMLFGVSEIMSYRMDMHHDADHRTEAAGLNAKLDSVGNQNTNLGNLLLGMNGRGKFTEADRRRGIEDSLRSEYILHHDPIAPQILAGHQYPPAEWMNKRLHDLGEDWTLSPETPRAPAPRSYIVLDGSPKFTGPNAAGVEGGDFVAGSPIEFNIHYRNTGPNALVLGSTARAAYIKDDYKSETQDAVLSEFTEEIKKEKSHLKERTPDPSHVHTMGSGTSEFFTVASLSDTVQPVTFTQDDLNELKVGGKIAFVVTEIDYKDSGIQHHFRMCMWLQPPATANGTWHFCDVFNGSD